MSDIHVILDDAFEHIKTLNVASVKLIIADPDYVYPKTQYRPHMRVNANKWSAFSATGTLFRNFVAECKRVTGDDGYVLFFCDAPMSALLYPIFFENFYYVRELTWNKMRIGMGGFWRAQTEKMLFGASAPISDKSGDSDILEYPAVPPKDRIHPYEKPLALMEKILTKCTRPADLVYDPFSGSGVVPQACKKLNRSCIACEINEERHALIMQRLADPQQQLRDV